MDYMMCVFIYKKKLLDHYWSSPTGSGWKNSESATRMAIIYELTAGVLAFWWLYAPDNMFGVNKLCAVANGGNNSYQARQISWAVCSILGCRNQSNPT